jgi:hypothetical protein
VTGADLSCRLELEVVRDFFLDVVIGGSRSEEIPRSLPPGVHP